MKIEMKTIGTVHNRSREVPRHWTISTVEGTLVVDRKYIKGLQDIHAGQRIVVIFYFHKSPCFEDRLLCQTPPNGKRKFGVFSTCSPRRPNPIGLSMLEVLAVKDNAIQVKGLDMLDGTPILDIKPLVMSKDHFLDND